VTCLLQEQGVYQVVFTADQCEQIAHALECQAAIAGTRGAPRVQYERTYVLLPPHTGEEWALAVVDGAWDHKRYTIGGSADDAGIGDLSARQVIAVNAGQWGGDLKVFFDSNYPGVQYDSIDAATPEQLCEELKRRA
jgi:hypothetical protein